jgi:hypothetical protein
MGENLYKNNPRSQASQQMQSQTSSSQWVDQPRPSGGFICFSIFFPVLLFLILGTTLIRTYFVATPASLIVEGVIFALLLIGFVVIFGLLLRMSYKIKYVLDEHTLHLYSGQKIAFSIPFYQITQAQKSAYNRRLLGWGIGTAGLCNRFRNGVCLTVTKGRSSYKLYISPTNPDDFLEHFNEHKQLP